ncbi:hypothetical protein MMC31_008237 [Peltigera leucophlebia]|nr:hypothetical protein [Peltigera leucophlebia]
MPFSYDGIPLPARPSVQYDHVLTIPAVEKLQSNHLLSARPDEMHRWDIGPLGFYTDLPYIKFHDGKIPAYFNQPYIALYLGFTVDVGVKIFMDEYIQGMDAPTRSRLMAAVHNHIDVKWAARTHLGTAIGTPMASTVMTEMGLTPEIQGEVNALYLEFDRNAGIFQEYFDNNHDKMVDNLEMVDFIHELVNKRMKKLEKLNAVVLQMVH